MNHPEDSTGGPPGSVVPLMIPRCETGNPETIRQCRIGLRGRHPGPRRLSYLPRERQAGSDDVQSASEGCGIDAASGS